MGGPVSLKKRGELAPTMDSQLPDFAAHFGFGQRWESPWVMGKGEIPTGKKHTCLSCLDFEAIAVAWEHFFGFIYLIICLRKLIAASWSTFKNCRQRMTIVVSSNDTSRKIWESVLGFVACAIPLGRTTGNHLKKRWAPAICSHRPVKNQGPNSFRSVRCRMPKLMVCLRSHAARQVIFLGQKRDSPSWLQYCLLSRLQQYVVFCST